MIPLESRYKLSESQRGWNRCSEGGTDNRCHLAKNQKPISGHVKASAGERINGYLSLIHLYGNTSRVYIKEKKEKKMYLKSFGIPMR